MADYGSWLASGNILALMAIIGGGLDIILTQRLSVLYAKKDFKEYNSELTAGIINTLICCTIILAVGLFVANKIPSLIKANPKSSFSLSLSFKFALFGFIFQLLFYSIKAIPQSLLKTFTVGLFELLARIISLFSIFYFINKGFGVVSFGLQQLVSGCALFVFTSVIAISVLKKNLEFKLIFSLEKIREQLMLFGPILLGRSGNVLIQNLQLPIISRFFTPEVAAIYALTSKIFDVGNMLFQPICQSFYPYLSAAFVVEKSKTVLIINNLSRLFISAVLFVFVFLIVFNKYLLFFWLGSNQFIGYPVTIALGFAYIVQVFNTFSGMTLISIGMQKKATWCGMIDLVLRTIFLCLSINFLNLIALPFSYFFSTFCITFFFFNSLYKKANNNFLSGKSKWIAPHIIFLLLIHLIFRYFISERLIEEMIFLLASYIFILLTFKPDFTFLLVLKKKLAF